MKKLLKLTSLFLASLFIFSAISCTKPNDDGGNNAPPTSNVAEYELSLDVNTRNRYYVGEKIDFKVKYLKNNRLVDFTEEITWTSDCPTCVYIDNETDTITPIALPSEVTPGVENTITLTGTHNEKSKVSFTITVYYISTKFNLTAVKEVDTLTVGQTIESSKVFTQAAGAFTTNLPLNMESSDSSVIEVVNGNLIAKKTGEATITAKTTYNKKEYNADNSVSANVSVIFNVDKTNLVIADDDTDTINVTSVYLKHNNQAIDVATLSYDVSDQTIASVNENGVVTGLKQGKVNVYPTVVYDGQTYSGDPITVSVYDDENAISSSALTSEQVKKDSIYFDWNGRVMFDDNNTCFMHNSTGFTVTFVGTKLDISIMDYKCDAEATPRVRLYLDGEDYGQYLTSSVFNAIKNLDYGLHTVRMLKVNSSWTNGKLNGIALLNLITDGQFVPTEKRTLKFEFFGDSITAGYGCGQPDYPQYTTANFFNEDGTKTYAQYTADYFNAESSIIASSGWTLAYDQPTWKSMIPRYFEGYYLHTNINAHVPSVCEDNHYDVTVDKPDVVFINLCTNDLNNTILAESFGGNTTARDNAFVNGYKGFLATIRNAYPDAKIVCVNGLMRDSGALLIHRAITEFNSTNVYQVTLPANTNGLGSHPDEIGNRDGAEVLINFLIDNGIVADPNA
ncbi:MAG: hypothetical protein J6B16_01925 [Clostridia bacterium]|nr:hypothetical protein [Clostridia bacterium]